MLCIVFIPEYFTKWILEVLLYDFTNPDMESLPKQFVSAMRTLFDIMDDKHTGYVRLTDIENRWRDDRTKGLPLGVIESLQKVASHDGLLTFDRFCTGLKICLLRNQVEHTSGKDRFKDEESAMRPQIDTQVYRPPSAPLLDTPEDQNMERNWDVIKNIENSANSHRTVSMPQLVSRKEIPAQVNIQNHNRHSISRHENKNRLFGPPKPPRLEKNNSDRKETQRTNYRSEDELGFDSEEVVETKITFESISRTIEEQSRGLGDGRSTENQTLRRTSRRREPRRHTLHNGVDYNLLKRMKQIEQEKDVLLQGLSAVEEAREWYLKQLTEVQEKMRYVGRVGAYLEPWSEAHQERLELLRARVFELNRQLGALASGWHHGPLSLHMNLALPIANQIARAAPTNAAFLKSQNRMLAEEVNRKNERISLLEREKSALIRELLIQRNRTKMIENFS